MVDSDGRMDLGHVAALPAVDFVQADVYSPGCKALIASLCRGDGIRFCVLAGMHLCGSLSPRLIDLFEARRGRLAEPASERAN